jgi:TorA maturation chaperone TorD
MSKKDPKETEQDKKQKDLQKKIAAQKKEEENEDEYNGLFPKGRDFKKSLGCG